MTKKNLFDQPGIEQLIPGKELPVAVKVTGRNMHAVSLLVSSRADHGNTRAIVASFFNEDGSLSHIEIEDKTGKISIDAGKYLVLGDDRKHLMVIDKGQLEFRKQFLNIMASIDDAAVAIADSLVKTLNIA